MAYTLVSVILLVFLLTEARIVFAADPPNLLSPDNNSTTSSSSLTWQTPAYQLYSSNPYRVQVDDDQSFNSLNKDYYTDNTSYTPSLSESIWHWRVKVKDLSGTWSDWSNVWSFTLVAPSPTPAPTLSPSPTPNPTTTPTTAPSSSFAITNTPSQINSNQSFNIKVNLSIPNNSSTIYFLKGAFKKTDGTRYFGLTKTNSEWIEYGEDYLDQYKVTTDSSGNWNGDLEIKIDLNDKDYKGSGDYIFKVGRFTEGGSGPSWSNESTIKILDNTKENTPTSKPNPSPNPSSLPVLATEASKITPSPKTDYKIASVAGATKSAQKLENKEEVKVKNQKQNISFFAGLILIFAASLSLGYIYIKKR